MFNLLFRATRLTFEISLLSTPTRCQSSTDTLPKIGKMDLLEVDPVIRRQRAPAPLPLRTPPPAPVPHQRLPPVDRRVPLQADLSQTNICTLKSLQKLILRNFNKSCKSKKQPLQDCNYCILKALLCPGSVLSGRTRRAAARTCWEGSSSRRETRSW